MKNKAKKALHTAETKDLLKQLNELYVSFAKIRLEKKVGKVNNPRLVSGMADDIARLKTELRARQLQEAVKGKNL